jgi:outer membrane protein OmpA-like peptidoglycan-associated protein
MCVKEIVSFCFLLFAATYCSGQTSKHRVLVAETIYFGSGSANVEKSYELKLKQIADMQKENTTRLIWIHAHTDSIGTTAYNEQLSADRAQGVERTLERLGADSLRMDIRHYGPYSPTGNNQTESGRAENRRVAVYIIEPLDSSKFGIWGILRGQVRDASTDAPLVCDIYITSLSAKDTVRTDSNGYFTHSVENFNPTELRASRKGYFFVSKVQKPLFQDTLTVNFSLERAIVGGKMMLNDLYFQMGTAQLLPSSQAALEGILSFLSLNDELKIEIGGHVNRPNEPPLETSSASYRLSESRAKSVYDALIERGISRERLSFKGYGNWEMLYPNAETELQQLMNRRVELKVTE